jgi:hypothetical protein
VDHPQFEAWLKKLSDPDRAFLEKHASWKKAYAEVQKKQVLPKDFIAFTMEILEDGSESET